MPLPPVVAQTPSRPTAHTRITRSAAPSQSSLATVSAPAKGIYVLSEPAKNPEVLYVYQVFSIVPQTKIKQIYRGDSTATPYLLVVMEKTSPNSGYSVYGCQEQSPNNNPNATKSVKINTTPEDPNVINNKRPLYTAPNFALPPIFALRQIVANIERVDAPISPSSNVAPQVPVTAVIDRFSVDASVPTAATQSSQISAAPQATAPLPSD